MKKFFLSALILFGSIFCYAQNFIEIKTDRNCIGVYNSLTEKYDFNDIIYADITFKVYNEYISVDDNSSSIYRIKENYPKKINKDSEILSAKCLDEKNRECVVGVMCEKSGQKSISVIYGNIMYIYFIK